MARSVRRGPTLPRTSSDRAGPRGSNRSESRGSVDFAARDGRQTRSAVAVDCTPGQLRCAAARGEGFGRRRCRTCTGEDGPRAGHARRSSAGASRTIGAVHRITDVPCPDSPCSARRPGSAVGRAGTLRGGESQAPAPPGAAPHRYALRLSSLLSPPERPHALSVADAARTSAGCCTSGRWTHHGRLSRAVRTSPTRSMPDDRAHSSPADTTRGLSTGARAPSEPPRVRRPRGRVPHASRGARPR